MVDLVYQIANTLALINRSLMDNTSSLDINLVPSTDWNLIFATIFLGLCALLVPFLERYLRYLYRPKLEFLFKLVPPNCHLTKYPPSEPVYYFRLEIENTGSSQAKKCEVVLEKIWKIEREIPKEVPNFSPGNLLWVGANGQQYIDINPRRSVFCDLGHIASRHYQRTNELLQRVPLIGCDRNDLCFMLELSHHFYAQPDCLHPGNYILDIAIFSENADYKKTRLKISWSGEWRDSEIEMFREIDIRQIDHISARDVDPMYDIIDNSLKNKNDQDYPLMAIIIIVAMMFIIIILSIKY